MTEAPISRADEGAQRAGRPDGTQGEDGWPRAKQGGLRRRHPVDILVLDLRAPDGGEVNFCCLVHSLCAIRYSSLCRHTHSLSPQQILRPQFLPAPVSPLLLQWHQPAPPYLRHPQPHSAPPADMPSSPAPVEIWPTEMALV